MKPKTGEDASRRRRWTSLATVPLAGALLAGAALIGTAFGAAPTAANAYTYWPSKYSGKVVFTDQVVGTHFRIHHPCVWINGFCWQNDGWSPALIAPPVRIARAKIPKHKHPTAQYIRVTWKIQRLNNGSWYTHVYYSKLYKISKTRKSFQTAQWSQIPTAAYDMRTVLTVKWTDSKKRKIAGYKAVMNQSRDYRCETRFPCMVQPHSIWLKDPSVN